MSWSWSRGFAAFLFSVTGTAAQAADVTITDAKIAGGKLVVTGTTATAIMNLTLDSQFTGKSNASKAFTFSVVYLPIDCIVNVGKTGVTATTSAVVANCAARGLNAQGAWTATQNYLVNDVVTQLGSVWRALKDGKNKSPSVSANATYWEKFVSKGDPGAAGTAGAKGDKGDKGLKGDKGDTGTAGLAGAAGAPGGAGASGAAGAKGDKGDQGDQGLQGSQGAAGPIGMTWRGTWDEDTAYVVNNVVQSGGKAFIAIADSIGQNPFTAAPSWSIVVSGLRPRGAYNGGTIYAFGDVVSLNGSSYMSLQAANAGHDPAASPTFWSAAASKGDTGAAGADGTNGTNGATGAKGDKGDTGNTGAQGATGAAGTNGTNGAAGAKGDTGNTGAQGATGAVGASGIVSVTSLDSVATGVFPQGFLIFAGNPAAISVASGQKITYYASAWMDVSGLSSQGTFYYGLCKLNPDNTGTMISPYNLGRMDDTAINISVGGTISGLAADSYSVGVCGTSTGFGTPAVRLIDSRTSGWVMVHN